VPDRTSMSRVRQSRPDYGLGSQAKVRGTFLLVPSSLGGGLTSDSCEVGILCIPLRKPSCLVIFDARL